LKNKLLGDFMKSKFIVICLIYITVMAQHVDIKKTFIDGEYKLPNIVWSLDSEDDLEYKTNASQYCPVQDEEFVEHVRTEITGNENKEIEEFFSTALKRLEESEYSKLLNTQITAIQDKDNEIWIGTKKGLYILHKDSDELSKHESYGVGGPLSTNISDIGIDSKGNLWIGTPIGLSLFRTDGSWTSIRGKDGLPVEEITSLAIDKKDRLWIGTTQGAIFYTPYEEGRQWYYRAGKRYLINDVITDIVLSEDGMPVYFKLRKG